MYFFRKLVEMTRGAVASYSRRVANGMNRYARYLPILAAVGLLSCQKTPDRTEGAPRTTQTAQTTAPGPTDGEVEIPANTPVWIRLEKTLDSSKLKAGDHFSAALAEAIILNGKEVIPKGARVKGKVTSSATAQGSGTAGQLALELESVSHRGSSYALKTNAAALEAEPVKTNVDASGSKQLESTKSAVAPKNEMLQFILAAPVRVKS